MSEMTSGRLVSGLERVWLAAERIEAPFVNQCVLTPRVSVDAARLADAVARAGQVHPATRVFLRGRLRGLRWDVGDPSPPLHVVRPEDTSTTLDRSEAAPFLMMPMSCAGGPGRGQAAEVVLVEGDLPQIVVRTHHAAMDGRGTQRFVSDLLAALDGRPLRGGIAGPARDVQLLSKGPIRPEPPADAVSFTGAADPLAPPGSRWMHARVPPVAGPVLLRVLAALRDQVPGRLRVGIPIDLRPMMGPAAADHGGNLTGVATLTLGETTAGLAESVRALTTGDAPAAHVLAADTLRGTAVWLMAWVGRQVAAKHLRSGLYPLSASISNLGRHGLTLGGAPVQAFWIPPPSPGLPLFLTLCGDVEGLDLCARMPHALATQGRLEAFLAGLAQTLAARS